MRFSVTSRNVLSLTLITLVISAMLGVFFLTQLSILEVRQAEEEADGTARQFTALGNVRLKAADASEDALTFLGEDPVIQAFLEALPASSSYVVHAALQTPQGTTVGSSSTGASQSLDTRDLQQLSDMNVVTRAFSLLRRGQLFTTKTPLTRGQQEIGVLTLLIDTSLVQDRLRSLLLESWWIILIALLLAWLAAVSTAVLTRRLVRRIQLQVDRLREGDFEFEPAPTSEPTFDRLASRLQQLGKEFQSDRLALLAEKKSFEEILQHIQLGVMVVDEQEHILFFNKPLVPLIGQSLEEAAGRPVQEILPKPNPLVRMLRRADQEQDLEAVRVTLPSTGRFRETIVSVFALAVDGEARGSTLLLEDLTGYKALMALADHSVRASELSREAAGFVHDIRSPLGTLLSHAEMLRMHTEGNEQAAKSLSEIEKAVDDVEALAEGFLDRLRRGPEETDSIDLKHLIEETAEFYRVDIESHGIELVLDLHDAPSIVDGDENRLRQVLSNLISNAVDAMPEGGRLTMRTSSPGAEKVVLEVHDTGSGIEPGEREKIFKLYHTSKPDGRGIGLAVVQQIVQEHGGSIRVESTPGEGAAFIIELPQEKGEDE